MFGLLSMRRLGILFAAVCFFAIPAWSQTCSNTAVGSFTCVRNATNNASATSTSVAFTGGYTSGQLIIIHGNCNGCTLASGNLSDTNAYTWTFWGDCPRTGSDQAVWYTTVPSTTAGSDTITLLNVGSTFTFMNAVIYSGVGLIDGAGVCSPNNSASTNLASGNYTVHVGDLNLGFGVNSTGLIVAGTGWADRENDAIGGGPFSMIEDQVAASTTANSTFTSMIGTWSAIGIAFRALLQPNSGGQIISNVQLPQLVPTTSFPGEQATVLTPANGAALTTALTGVACGTTIRLTHGATYSTATAFPLTTNCTCRSASNVYNNSQWIIIESDSYIGGSVRGTRIDPSAEYGKLAYISSSDTNEAFSATNNSAGCYWLLGLDIFENGANNFAGISWGDVSSLNYPHDIVVDHSYVHGSPALTMQHCILLNGTWETVVDNYVSDCHGVGQDTQAVTGRDGYGPMLIQNNFLSAAGENFMEGGALPFIAGIVPADFTIKGNHFFKPLNWIIRSPSYAGIFFTVKNLFENKNIQRELVMGNVFQNNSDQNQNGKDLLFDVENVSSGNSDPNPAAAIQDVTFTLNKVMGGTGTGSISTSNSNVSPLNQPAHRLSFHDNLYTGIDECLWGGCGSQNSWNIDSIPPTALFAPYDITFSHETISSASMSTGINFNATPGVDLHYGITITNSILDGGLNGVFFGNISGAGNSIIANYAPAANFTNNCGYGGHTSFGNLSNFANSQTPANQAAVFVNPGADWHVAPTSVCYHAASDGLSMGANIDAINAATANVVQTLSVPVTVTGVSPSTFTHTGGTGLTISGTGFLAESGLGVIIGGAGPSVSVSSDTGTGCAVPGQFTVNGHTDTTHFTYAGNGGTCTVVAAASITLAVNDTINVYDSGSLGAYTENINRYTPGNVCTSVMVTSSTTITCNTPAASGTVTTGPVSVFVSQWGIPVQSTVFGNYN